MDDQFCYLPPGFRFRPTDEEIITHYLINKIADQNFFSLAISQANFNDCEPWDLPRKAKMGDKEWYFFCQIDRKYPTGMRTNRATKAGYWKTTGKDKEIFKGKGVVGKKKTLVFYQGRAPRGQRTNWVMQEYRLEGKQQAYYNICTQQMDWVVCKVYHKTKDTNSNSSKKLPSKMSSSADNMLAENTNMTSLLHSTCFNPSNQELEGQQVLENDFKKSIFSSQSYLLYCPWSLHQEKGNLRAPFISNQGKVGSSTERNGEASSTISMHQICNLHYLDAQVLDLDSIMNYESL